MSMEDLTRLTVAQLAQRIRSKEVSPVEVAEAFLRRIEAVEPKLNAFITRLDDHARRAAATAEAEIMAGEYRGPFHGIPVGLKDLFWTKDIRTTSGSLLDADFVPAEDSAVASRLMAAGAYCIGKLHMTEFAFDGTSRNHHYGPARNPWDTARMAGGSSSGSGVAVASGEAPIALGTDTGGSVRVPAALCGITGLQADLRPHQPLRGHSAVLVYGPRRPAGSNCGGRGPGAQRVGRTRFQRPGLSRCPDSGLHTGPGPRGEGNAHRCAAGVRMGHGRPGSAQAFDEAVAVMESLGAEVQEVSIADLELINPAGSVVQTAEAATIHRSRLLASGDRYDPVIRRRFESGLFVPAEAYLTAQRVRARCRQSILDTLERVDLLAVPTTSIAAPLIEQESVAIAGQDVSTREALLRITRIFSAVGLPAISIPCGLTEERLPIGLQLVGKPLSETLVLQAAHAYQTATSWHLERPEL